MSLIVCCLKADARSVVVVIAPLLFMLTLGFSPFPLLLRGPLSVALDFLLPLVYGPNLVPREVRPAPRRQGRRHSRPDPPRLPAAPKMPVVGKGGFFDHDARELNQWSVGVRNPWSFISWIY